MTRKSTDPVPESAKKGHKPIRLNVQLGIEEDRLLRLEAERTGATIAETLRKAINNRANLLEIQRKGQHLAVWNGKRYVKVTVR